MSGSSVITHRYSLYLFIIYSIQAHIKEYLLTNTKDCQIEQRSKETPLLTLNLLNIKEFKKKKAIDFAKKGK